MRELNTVGEIIQQHYPLSKRQGIKRWCTAQSRKHYDQHTMHNDNIEASYHQVIKSVKSLYMKPEEVYFERDYKQDKTEGLFGMHCFLTSDFYWRLDCEFTYNYIITFAFDNCPFENEIRRAMVAYPLDRTVIEKQLEPDFQSFYQAVLRVQEPCYLLSYKGLS